MSFGGTAYCPTCDRAVYAAEKVMGPGRKLYHKMCLKCTSCGKQLNQGSLVEHNQEPYCKNCHIRLFGTRDLRSANLSPVSKSRPPSWTPSSPPLTTTYSFSPTTSPRLSSKNSISPHVPSPDSTEEELVLPRTPPEDADKVDDMTTDLDVEFGTKHSGLNFVESAGLQHSFTGAEPPLRQAYTGLAQSNPVSARMLRPTATGAPTPSKVQRYVGSQPNGAPRLGGLGGGTPLCPTCNTAVYFAEQVKACGRIWHKRCLRCVECNTPLDSTRLTERDGDPMCRSCYSKTAGPQGAGYGLHGGRGV